MSILAGLLLAGCSGTQPAEAPSETEPARIAAAGFVGRKVCAVCHRKKVELWDGSHHDLAMQVASGETVLGNFEGATFTYNGITSTFFKREGLPGNVELLLFLTTLYRDNGTLEAAIRYADKLIELAPENTLFRQLRAQLEVPEW